MLPLAVLIAVALVLMFALAVARLVDRVEIWPACVCVTDSTDRIEAALPDGV